MNIIKALKDNKTKEELILGKLAKNIEELSITMDTYKHRFLKDQIERMLFNHDR